MSDIYNYLIQRKRGEENTELSFQEGRVVGAKPSFLGILLDSFQSGITLHNPGRNEAGVGALFEVAHSRYIKVILCRFGRSPTKALVVVVVVAANVAARSFTCAEEKKPIRVLLH